MKDGFPWHSFCYSDLNLLSYCFLVSDFWELRLWTYWRYTMHDFSFTAFKTLRSFWSCDCHTLRFDYLWVILFGIHWSYYIYMLMFFSSDLASLGTFIHIFFSALLCLIFTLYVITVSNSFSLFYNKRTIYIYIYDVGWMLYQWSYFVKYACFIIYISWSKKCWYFMLRISPLNYILLKKKKIVTALLSYIPHFQ